MVRVTFTDNLRRHVECPPTSVAGANIRDVLAAVFVANPRAKGYVLDDQGGVRRHMIVFVNGQAIQDRTGLSDTVPDGAEVYVMQALSGG